MKELNLVEILKDVPKGVELYSTTYGSCTLNGIVNTDKEYPINITVTNKNGDIYDEVLTSGGACFFDFNGECVLFPSKENRSWEGWKYNPLKEGDSVMAGDSNKEDWSLAKYVKDNIVVISGKKTCVQYIVHAKDFDFDNIESNIHKSVV